MVYKNEGWISWCDWLGNGYRRNEDWRPFEPARKFVRFLGLKSQAEWFDFCKSGQKPNDIPVDAYTAYKGSGWVSWGDWLGTGRHVGGWRHFKESRKFARSLGLKTIQDWNDYCKSGQKPYDIPASPMNRYKNTGWVSWSDFLGSENRRRNWQTFKQAREFVRSMKLGGKREWLVYCKFGLKPVDIPKSPYGVYKSKGWVSWPDWLGTGHEWRPFKELREFVRSLGLKSQREWRAWSKTDARPNDIPANPNQVYRDDGWQGFRDWLGTV